MVDVSGKAETVREAVAEGDIRMSAAALRAIRQPAASRRAIRSRRPGSRASWPPSGRAEIIPLCHPLPLTHVDVDLVPTPRGYDDSRAARRPSAGPASRWKRSSRPSVAALTLYDMLKAVDRAMVIGPVRLREKRGGRSGHYRRR